MVWWVCTAAGCARHCASACLKAPGWLLGRVKPGQKHRCQHEECVLHCRGCARPCHAVHLGVGCVPPLVLRLHVVLELQARGDFPEMRNTSMRHMWRTHHEQYFQASRSHQTFTMMSQTSSAAGVLGLILLAKTRWACNLISSGEAARALALAALLGAFAGLRSAAVGLAALGALTALASGATETFLAAFAAGSCHACMAANSRTLMAVMR